MDIAHPQERGLNRRLSCLIPGFNDTDSAELSDIPYACGYKATAVSTVERVASDFRDCSESLGR